MATYEHDTEQRGLAPLGKAIGWATIGAGLLYLGRLYLTGKAVATLLRGAKRYARREHHFAKGSVPAWLLGRSPLRIKLLGKRSLDWRPLFD